MLARQPVLRFKLMAILHELENTLSLNPYKYLNKSRWKGKIGWGPRFKGWETYLSTHATLEFNAMQWATSVEAVKSAWDLIDDNRKIEVRYETLLTDPRNLISSILTFLACRPSEAFFSSMPPLMPGNFNKWEKEFTPTQVSQISPVLESMLREYHYK